MKLNSKDLLSFAEVDADEVNGMIGLAIQLKEDLKRGRERLLLKNRSMAMIFEKPSTRTRISFETGMHQMGGHAINMTPSEMQLSRGETIQDTARTLSRYVDVVMMRIFDHSMLEALAENATIPVINGLSDSYHPCQTLADLMTIRENKNRLNGLKVGWVGDGNNVCNSLIYGCSKVGMDISIATPREFQPIQQVVREAGRFVDVEIMTDPAMAVRDADVVMTDTFSSIHNTDPNRIKRFLPKYQVSESLMCNAREDAIFMHCLPAKRGEEVTAGVIDGPRSVVWDEAENRLHSQKALLAAMLDARV